MVNSKLSFLSSRSITVVFIVVNEIFFLTGGYAITLLGSAGASMANTARIVRSLIRMQCTNIGTNSKSSKF